MAKFLKDIIGETYVMETSAHPSTQGTHSRSEDEERFVAKHKPTRFDNMYTTGEHAADYDKVFGAGNIDMANRKDHGYTGSPTPTGPLQEPKPGEDAAVYEDVQLDEDAELKPLPKPFSVLHHDGDHNYKQGIVTHAAIDSTGNIRHVMIDGKHPRHPDNLKHDAGDAVDVKARVGSADPRFDD